MSVLFWLSGIECYLPPFLIVVSAGELYTFQITRSWCLLLFVVHLFWTEVSCLSSVMVHPSSYKTPNDISWAVLIFKIV